MGAWCIYSEIEVQKGVVSLDHRLTIVALIFIDIMLWGMYALMCWANAGIATPAVMAGCNG